MSNCAHAATDGCFSDFVPTVANEINKLVSNVAMGRSWAGIHCRSDSMAGIRLGEDVAISSLQDLVPRISMGLRLRVMGDGGADEPGVGL